MKFLTKEQIIEEELLKKQWLDDKLAEVDAKLATYLALNREMLSRDEVKCAKSYQGGRYVYA